MSGVAAGRVSIVGCADLSHLKLGNLIAIYDDNSELATNTRIGIGQPFQPVLEAVESPTFVLTAEITIDGDTAVSFTENVEMRYKSYGWNVLHVEKGDE